MIELFLSFYGLSTLYTIALGLPLAVCGPHLCARGKFLELLPLTQLAVLIFHLLALLALKWQLPTLVTFALQLILSMLGMSVLKKHLNPTALGAVCLYLLLMSTDHALLTLFPTIETRAHGALFGDMVTLNGAVALASALCSIALALYYWRQYKTITRETFEVCILGKSPSSLFDYSALLAIILALYNLGPIHTLALVAFPSFVLGARFKSFKLATCCTLLAFALAPIFGVSAVFWAPRLPTLTLVLFFLVAFLFLCQRYFSYSTHSKGK